MYRWKKIWITCLFLVMSMINIQANEMTSGTGITFSGESEKFITHDQNSAYENMMPGETRTQRFTLKNEDYRELKFYVKAEYDQPLGQGSSNEQIAYDVKFSTEEDVLYTGKLGGMTQANMESLKTNYLLKTLKQGETVTVDLTLQVDGASMDNTYQDKEGYLNFIFSVEHEENTPIEKVVTIIQKVPVINKIPGVSTGDRTVIGVIGGVMVTGLVAMILLIILKVKERRGEQHE